MQVFNVQGMTCGHCVRGITSAIQEADSDAGVQVDLAAGTVKVQTHLGAEQLIALIEQEGYHAKSA
ncbi:heavy-metal-associated domain-containing protein [Pseudomonas gregormendelii]|uniref:Heavy-metal-associated domain-containing protein n=1 Tax=Pseudomonas gregormendelii TaxID=1628277 RepID=A0ABS3AN69_9PSED|nr:cation transporter [Pseudomonas gregormendelii]MBN3968618.1 heavy-metal-associated domain-containing protein [Pseudomonas gregormendelii]